MEDGAWEVAILFTSRTSLGHTVDLLVVMWRRACLVRWSLRMNRRSQTGQTNFFSPVCVRRCLDSSSERANFLSHPSQWQLKGFSPEIQRKMINNHTLWVQQPIKTKTCQIDTNLYGFSMSLQMGTFEVSLLASLEVADVVPPAREVRLCHSATLTWGHVDWSGCQGQELRVPKRNNALLADGGLGYLRLRDDKHHSALSHRWAHQKRLRMWKNGLRPRGLHLNLSLNKCGDDSSLPVNRKHLTEHRRAGYGRLRNGRLWCWDSNAHGLRRRGRSLRFCSVTWAAAALQFYCEVGNWLCVL